MITEIQILHHLILTWVLQLIDIATIPIYFLCVTGLKSPEFRDTCHFLSDIHTVINTASMMNSRKWPSRLFLQKRFNVKINTTTCYHDTLIRWRLWNIVYTAISYLYYVESMHPMKVQGRMLLILNHLQENTWITRKDSVIAYHKLSQIKFTVYIDIIQIYI